MFPRAQLNILYLILTFFTALHLVSSRSAAVSPNNETKNTEGQVGSKTKQQLRQQNNDVIAAHVRPPLSIIIIVSYPDPTHKRERVWSLSSLVPRPLPLRGRGSGGDIPGSTGSQAGCNLLSEGLHS